MISSTANPHVKHIRSLVGDRKGRRHERLFVLEGVRLIGDALSHGAELVLTLFSPEQLAGTDEGSALMPRLGELPQVYPATPAVVAAASDTITPQGVVALARWPRREAAPTGVTLVLDAVQDPGNVGTLLRTADAVGVAQVLCLRGTADLFSPKVVRAGMGAHFRLAMEQDLGWEDVGGKLAFVDHVYAADAGAHMPYYAADWRQTVALIVGNEAHGLSDDARSMASKLISIPMRGATESLNAAMAGSVILFEALRQRSLGRS